MRTLIPLLLTIITFASVAVGQSQKDKIEIGVQSTSLSLFHPDLPFDDTQGGIGARVTYNFNRSIAAEAEVNFFPQKQLLFSANGGAIQAQFGAKVGKRFEKFGVFAKVRPGFLSVNDVGSFTAGPNNTLGFKIERETFFTLDTGGVLELYPSRRAAVRFEAGDTLIRHPDQLNLVFTPSPVVDVVRPAKFKSNFQFTAGISFRLGDFPEEESSAKTSSDGPERTRRYEVGVQFTSLFVEPSNNRSFFLTNGRTRNEPGFGGRFTFNLTDNIAFEAEGNYFTRIAQSGIQGGHLFQGQFGGKVGKRFDRWGLFGKARPGFVGFTRVFEFIQGSQGPAVVPFERKLYPSLDVGGVVEFYISPRWMARFDVGDTMIRYGEIRFEGFTMPIILQPEQWRHNLQLSSGIGFRF
jgi:hypothetical protein